MATVTLPYNDQTIKRITQGISKPVTNAKVFFQTLGSKIFTQTMLTFKAQGARAGQQKWKSFSNKTLKTKLDTWRLRYGTDTKPKRNRKQLNKYKTENNLWYVPGPMKGYKGDRRYNRTSKLLQASGMFRESFKILKTSKKYLYFGTKHKLAKDIMSNPERNVLFVTDKDITLYRSMWRKFIDDGIKI